MSIYQPCSMVPRNHNQFFRKKATHNTQRSEQKNDVFMHHYSLGRMKNKLRHISIAHRQQCLPRLVQRLTQCLCVGHQRPRPVHGDSCKPTKKNATHIPVHSRKREGQQQRGIGMTIPLRCRIAPPPPSKETKIPSGLSDHTAPAPSHSRIITLEAAGVWCRSWGWGFHTKPAVGCS